MKLTALDNLSCFRTFSGDTEDPREVLAQGRLAEDTDSQWERHEFPLYGLADNPELLTALSPLSL